LTKQQQLWNMNADTAELISKPTAGMPLPLVSQHIGTSRDGL
jgi:hypothetical protein